MMGLGILNVWQKGVNFLFPVEAGTCKTSSYSHNSNGDCGRGGDG